MPHVGGSGGGCPAPRRLIFSGVPFSSFLLPTFLGSLLHRSYYGAITFYKNMNGGNLKLSDLIPNRVATISCSARGSPAVSRSVHLRGGGGDVSVTVPSANAL